MIFHTQILKKIKTFGSLFLVLTNSAIAQNVGIGTNQPKTKLDVNGALSARVTSLPAASAVTIPDDVTLFRLTNTAGGSTTALSIANPKEGQFLTIINEDDNSATLNGHTIPSGTSSSPSIVNLLNIGGTLTGWKTTGDNTVTSGPVGATGAAVLNGTWAPTGGQGSNGDFFINTTTKFIYGPKAGGAWPTGVSLVGSTGATGTAGTNGTNGTNGAAGAAGATGTAGTNGTNGTNGAAGATGATGIAGTNGTNGAVGATGAQGIQGATGTAGTNGTNGTNGAAGATGATGTAGTNGTNGAVGATGSQGIQGITGATGTAGTNGTNGTNGAVGATGTAGTNGTNGAVGATGAAVLNGTSAPTGGQGSNGDFFINTTTKFIYGPKAAGAWPTGASLVGSTGATGTNGTNGTNGAAGATGATGTNGTNGTNGAVGVTGATGTAGTNGVAGATGTAGTNGTNGAVGATGPTGAAGPTGTISGLTNGQVVYGSAIGGAAQSNSFFWDATNSRLGVGTNTPANTFSVGSGSQFQSDYSGNVSIASSGSLTLTGTQTGQLFFPNSTGRVSQSNSLVWDITNSRLGIGTNTPANTFSVGSGSQFQSDYSGNVSIASSGSLTLTGTQTGQLFFPNSTGRVSQSNSLIWDITNSRLGIGTNVPANTFSVGSSNQFQVNSNGDLVKIKNVSYSFPISQASANQVLTNDGAGNLSWAAASTNLNLTGAVTSVGSTTSLGSFTSANLSGAMGDETGSGVAVFATSPTLVTPNLGTPSAAILTNATGLPLTSGVTGVLPVANGGTGLSAAPSNGQIDIGNGTGFTRAALTAGTGISITNGVGSITVATTGAAPTGAAGGDLTGTYPNPSIATSAVTTLKIADLNVTNAKIADNAINNPKILDNAVTNSKILDDAVNTNKILNSSVTYAKIQNVTGNRLLGNPTGAAAVPSEISLGTGLSFVGSTLTGTAGSVTSVSVATANGFSGTVATATSTPAITLKTTVNGLLAGNSTTGVVSAATQGTDYLAPNTAITAATNTKITYDDEGLVTAGSQAAASDLSNGTSGTGAILLATSPSLTTPSIDGETYSTNAAVTAGTNAQGQGALTSDYNIITTAAANPSGVTLPSATTGRRIIIVNKGANAINVYPATSDMIDALGLSASISIPVGGWMEFNASSAMQWYSTANIAGVTATTSANLTGDVTSTGNATTYNNVVPSTKGGAGTVNGIMKANGSGTVSAAAAGTDYVAGLANPSAMIGLTAINGTATTAKRSDAASALSQAIIPTWSGLHTFTAGITATGTSAISLGADAAAKAISMGSTTGATSIVQRVGTGNFSLDGVAGSTYTIGASTTTGTITIGGTAQTGTIGIGTGTGAQALNLATGAGAKTLSLGSTNTTSTTTINAGTGGVNINTGAATNATTTLGTTGSQLFASSTANSDKLGIKPQSTTATAAFTGTLTSADLTAARTYTLPDATGTVAVSASGNIALSAAGNLTFTGTLPVANGGTGSATQNWVDLTATQTAAGAKTWSAAASFSSTIGVTGVSTLSGGAILGASLALPITTTSGNLTLDGTHFSVIVTGGTPNITLPAASGATGRVYVVVNQSTSSITISSFINTAGSNSTSLSASNVLGTTTSSNRVILQSNGTSWYQIN